MSDSSNAVAGKDIGTGAPRGVHDYLPWVIWTPSLVLLVAIYWNVGRSLYNNWTLTDSYYTHGFLIPPISAFLVWQRRAVLLRTKRAPSWLGALLMACSSVMLLLADFLGFNVFAQLSLLPMLTGLVLAAFGPRYLKLVWFPLFFLIFMVPIPPSLTQSIILDIKLLATEGAVRIARLCSLSMIREGSYVHFGQERLLVGEVCGGLRSLIALLSFGTLMAYISKTTRWAKVVILLLSGPIAIVSNTARIFALCVIGYFWGADAASGVVHDVSGILIFACAFGLLFLLETILRRIAPKDEGGPAS